MREFLPLLFVSAVIGFLTFQEVVLYESTHFGVSESAPAPTYIKDIRPLFKRSCLPCHGPGTGRNWLDYNTAYKKRKYIKFRVLARKDMPPLYWQKQLSDEERELIGKWVDEGAKE